MAFDLLPALRPREWRSVICVRVSRKWEYRGGTDDGEIQHVDLVLVDEKDNSMYGEIPGHEVEAKSPQLQEGGIYIIRRFRVSNAKSGYRSVDSPYMVEFTLHTTISPANPDLHDFPEYAYNITPISDLPSHAGDTRNFLDTIGLLVEKSDAYMIHLPNKPAPTLTRHIVLRDLSYSEMKVTLWGERAESFNIDDLGVDGKPIIVLFVGGLMKSYQRTYYLSANTASRWYFNPQIPEARQFYDSYRNQKIQIKCISAPLNQQGQLQPPPPLEEKTLRQLNVMDPHDFNDNGYRCTVTIARLVPNVSWWFASCNKCSKACTMDGPGYRCNNCSSTAYKFKYKISFVALDGTDEAEMICFGDIARRMIGKPVQQILRMARNSSTYPPDITKMVNLKFTFQIPLTQQSYYKEHKTYQIVSVVTSHGQQNAPPQAAADEGADHDPDTPEASHGVSAETDAQTSDASPGSMTHDGTPSVTVNTPPPTLLLDGETPTTKKGSSSSSSKRGKYSSARKKLVYPNDDDTQEHNASVDSPADTDLDNLDESGLADDTAGAGKKRSRGSVVLSEESG